MSTTLGMCPKCRTRRRQKANQSYCAPCRREYQNSFKRVAMKRDDEPLASGVEWKRKPRKKPPADKLLYRLSNIAKPRKAKP